MFPTAPNNLKLYVRKRVLREVLATVTLFIMKPAITIHLRRVLFGILCLPPERCWQGDLSGEWNSPEHLGEVSYAA
jgi:hypothetical protein